MILAALLLAQAAPAATPAPCPAAPRPGEAKGLPSSFAVTADPTAPVAVLTDRRYHVTLLPAASVHLAAPTSRSAAPESKAGVFVFPTAAAGRYRVALSAGAWVDVIADGKALPSAAHGHGPACSWMTKMVDYDLSHGSYLLQVVGGPAPVLDLSVTRIN